MLRRVILRNPVLTTIHPATWKRPAGNRHFVVTQPFGCTGVPDERPYGSCKHYHRAIDISDGRCGAVVVAAKAGTVRFSGTISGSKVVGIAIYHGNGEMTYYAHLATRSVVKGAKVSVGQKIATVGNTGTKFCHCHFGAKIGVDPAKSIVWGDGNGKWVDPYPLLAQNVTVHPKSGDGINIRTAPTLSDTTRFATTKAGKIVQLTGNKILGDVNAPYKWGGKVTGAAYTVDGVKSDEWELIKLDGTFRYVASLLAIRSQSI